MNRTFEESALTGLVVDALKSRVRDLQYVIQHPEVALGGIGGLKLELAKIQELLLQIKKEKLDIRFVSREY